MSALRNKLVTVTAIGAAGLGGAAIADAASNSSTASSSSTSQSPAAQRDPSQGGHRANGKTESLLTGDTAAKVEAAALAEVPGATVERVETDADHGSPYEAHVTKAGGTQLEVLVDKDFKVMAVNTMGQRP
jgi:hypothetical protein